MELGLFLTILGSWRLLLGTADKKIEDEKNAYSAPTYTDCVVVPPPATVRKPKQPADQSFGTRLENTMLASAVSFIECSVLFVALLRSLVSVATPKVGGALHYAFVLLPLSLILATQVTAAAAVEDVDD